MVLQDIALIVAAVIGSGVSVAHGIIVQRRMVQPIEGLFRTIEQAAVIRRLVPLMLHYSTICWFLGGFALIAAAIWFGQEARLATGLFVGFLYLSGSLIAFWATRGRHPVWIPYAVALILIGFGINTGG
ncbi:hypothetical protein [Paenibacillus harenae]|uniref:DUF1304 domain-containing protein n=1 Tax=Paenibacillus harenae TaxID=306543 RepID=A0ABT9U3L8_PAEHA|nr:hypothetical protein [Paenibacillus harenae]MDQ0114232.1 hypothetical protein [Paenibacillus harenae]